MCHTQYSDTVSNVALLSDDERTLTYYSGVVPLRNRPDSGAVLVRNHPLLGVVQIQPRAGAYATGATLAHTGCAVPEKAAAPHSDKTAARIRARFAVEGDVDVAAHPALQTAFAASHGAAHNRVHERAGVNDDEWSQVALEPVMVKLSQPRKSWAL